VVLAGAIAAGAAAPARATTVCGKQVVEDWRDNGRIDRLYKLHCYEEAIDAIPPELRDYTNAVDVIRQAYLSRTGTSLSPPPGEGPPSNPGVEPPPDETPTINTSGTTDIPLPVYVLGALALVLLGAGALGYVSRRRSRGDDEPPPA
jgi:hypothetical protein